jgi:hypothetical protein
MTLAAVLAEAHAAGVELSATPEGKIRWRCPGTLPEGIRQEIVCHKAELLALLQVWDQSAADSLLAELQAEVARIQREDFGGRLPPPLANVLADAIAIAQGYVTNHEAEARRGWDALELLRGMRAQVSRYVENWRQLASPCLPTRADCRTGTVAGRATRQSRSAPERK